MRSYATAIVCFLALVVGCTKPARVGYQGPRATPAFGPGAVDEPEMAAADKANLPDEESVIGVDVEGEARAYSLKGLSSVRSHIVNDVIADVPVSVTYCNKSDCSRSFTSPERGVRLPLTVGAFMGDSMMLKYQGKMYRQDTGVAEIKEAPPLPFESYPHERTTWGKWRTKHPKTTVFVGLPPMKAPPPE